MGQHGAGSATGIKEQSALQLSQVASSRQRVIAQFCQRLEPPPVSVTITR
jgi:hypothetical protein